MEPVGPLITFTHWISESTDHYYHVFEEAYDDSSEQYEQWKNVLADLTGEDVEHLYLEGWFGYELPSDY